MLGIKSVVQKYLCAVCKQFYCDCDLVECAAASLFWGSVVIRLLTTTTLIVYFFIRAVCTIFYQTADLNWQRYKQHLEIPTQYSECDTCTSATIHSQYCDITRWWREELVTMETVHMLSLCR